MARRRSGQEEEAARHTCADCGNAYDWHSPALDGHMTLCRCKYYTGGKWCRIATEKACGHFVKLEAE